MGRSDNELMTHIPGPECDQYWVPGLSKVGQEVDSLSTQDYEIGLYRYSPVDGMFS